MKSIIYILITSAVCALTLSAAPNLTGEWICTFGRYSETLSLNADGSYKSVTEIVRGPAQEKDKPVTGTWKFENGEIEFKHKAGSGKEKVKIISDEEFEVTDDMATDGVRQYQRSTPPPKIVAEKIEKSRVTEPKIGSPERKAIMDAMRGPVSKYAKTEIIFTGTAEVYEDWAKLGGHVTPKKGKFADDVIDEMETDFLAILQKVDGKWKTLYFGWSGDIGAAMEAREKCPKAPEALLPKIQQ
jgi:hypothetical protein